MGNGPASNRGIELDVKPWDQLLWLIWRKRPRQEAKGFDLEGYLHDIVGGVGMRTLGK